MSPSSAPLRTPDGDETLSPRARRARCAGEGAFPWRRAMAFGFGRLRLRPSDFWAMTPRELAAAVEGVFGVLPAPLDRAALDALIARYPDR